MLYYDRIDRRKGTDLAKSSNNKKCMICHYWFSNHEFKFQDSVFKFQDSVCNRCHDLTMFSVNKSDIAFIIIKNIDYRCIIHNISKSEAIDRLKDSVLEDHG